MLAISWDLSWAVKLEHTHRDCPCGLGFLRAWLPHTSHMEALGSKACVPKERDESVIAFYDLALEAT